MMAGPHRWILLCAVLAGCAVGRGGTPPKADASAPPRSEAGVVGAINAPQSIIPLAAHAPTTVRIIATADFHGALGPRSDSSAQMRGGAGVIAGAIAAAQRECAAPDCLSLVLDGGDLFRGSPASDAAHGRPVVDVFDRIGYSAAAVGNHEFDWGPDTLRMLMSAARFALLGANIRTTEGKDVDWIRNDTVIERGSVTVGVIGVTTRQTPQTTIAVNLSGLRFDDPAPIVDSITAALRARGVQVIVLLAHAGGECTARGECHGEVLDLAERLTSRVDVIVAAHTHATINTAINRIPILQPGARGEALAIFDIPLPIGGAPIRREIRKLFSDSIAVVPEIRDIAERAIARAQPTIGQPIARIAQTLPVPAPGEFALGNLVADAMRVVGRGDIAIVNSAGVRAALTAGTVDYGAAYDVLPFGNPLHRVRMRGRDLRVYLERALRSDAPSFHVSGMRVVYAVDSTAKIDSIVVARQPLEESTVYTVIVDAVILTGGGSFSFQRVAVGVEPAEIMDLDALIAYLMSLPQPVTSPNLPRLIAKQVRR